MGEQDPAFASSVMRLEHLMRRIRVVMSSRDAASFGSMSASISMKAMRPIDRICSRTMVLLPTAVMLAAVIVVLLVAKAVVAMVLLVAMVGVSMALVAKVGGTESKLVLPRT
jgi:hypothetical protein